MRLPALSIAPPFAALPLAICRPVEVDRHSGWNHEYFRRAASTDSRPTEGKPLDRQAGIHLERARQCDRLAAKVGSEGDDVARARRGNLRPGASRHRCRRCS